MTGGLTTGTDGRMDCRQGARPFLGQRRDRGRSSPEPRQSPGKENPGDSSGNALGSDPGPRPGKGLGPLSGARECLAGRGKGRGMVQFLVHLPGHAPGLHHGNPQPAQGFPWSAPQLCARHNLPPLKEVRLSHGPGSSRNSGRVPLGARVRPSIWTRLIHRSGLGSDPGKVWAQACQLFHGCPHPGPNL